MYIQNTHQITKARLCRPYYGLHEGLCGCNTCPHLFGPLAGIAAHPVDHLGGGSGPIVIYLEFSKNKRIQLISDGKFCQNTV